MFHDIQKILIQDFSDYPTYPLKLASLDLIKSRDMFQSHICVRMTEPEKKSKDEQNIHITFPSVDLILIQGNENVHMSR